MNQDRIAQDQTGFFLHLPHRGLLHRLILLDGASDEIVPIRVVTGHEHARTKLVPEHDLISAWIVAEHGHRIASLHHFPAAAPDSATVFLDVEFIAVDPQKSLVQRGSTVNGSFELSGCHFHLISVYFAPTPWYLPKFDHMLTQRALKRFLSFAMLAAVAACSSLPPGPRDLLDEHTGATVTVVGAPITFAREPTGQSSAHQSDLQSSHDFLTLVAIQKDDDGKYSQALLLYRWSVFFGPPSSAPEESAEELIIEIDGRSIELQPLKQLPAGLPSPKDLYVPDTTEAAMHAYATDVETMRLIATSHALTVRLPGEPLGGPFALWRDGRPALAQFVKQLSGT
jgi:hypothetical protein